MATIKDVARLAGVSFGTVSNVLNGKRVSAENYKRVQDAVKRLGYTPNVQARSLKTSRTMNAGIILPSISDPNYSQLFIGIERVLNAQGYTASLYTTSEIPANESRILKSIYQQNLDGIILVTCRPEEEAAFIDLEESGIPFVLVEREVRFNDYNFVGFDNRNSLRFKTSRLLEKGCRNIVIVTGPQEYSPESGAVQAVEEAVLEAGLTDIQSRVIITNSDRESAFKAYIESQRGAGTPDCIIATSTPILEGIQQALHITKAIDTETGKPSVISLGEDTWIYNYYPNTKIIPKRSMRAGEAAAEILMDAISNPGLHETVRTIIDNRSVKNSMADYSSGKHERDERGIETLKVLMLEGNASDATSALLPKFSSDNQVKVELTCLPYEELYEEISKQVAYDTYDVFQIDLPWFPEMAYDGFLLPLDEYLKKNPELISDFVPGVLESYAKVNDTFYGFPYLFGTQLLFYRKDLFENPDLRIKFLEIYGTDLEPPKNWTEFNAIAKFFTREFNPDSPVPYGTTLGASSSSGAVCEFLPRMWGYNGKPMDQYGNICLYSRETVRALENYTESFRYASPGSADNWWDEQVAEFSAGDAAMMVLFVAHVTDIVDRGKSKVVGKIGYAPIPGGQPILGGWSMGINKRSEKHDLAFRFLSWVSGRELSIPHTLLGGATPSLDLYKSSELAGFYPWLPKVLELFPSHRKRYVSKLTTGGTISERQYERIIGEAVHGAVTGKISPGEAIYEAQEKLRAIRNKKSD